MNSDAMNPNSPHSQSDSPNPSLHSRRSFLGLTGAFAGAATFAAGLPIARSAHAAGSDLIRLAFIGCGGRGTGAASQALSTSGPVKLVAMADLFADRIETSLGHLLKNEAIRGKIDVPPERRFTGFDAYRRAIESGVDMVILTTVPHFRPIHYAAAVAAGKHVYMEKPVAVDGPGVRAVMGANEEARKKKLAVAVGFQRRHQNSCRECIQQIRDGKIGDVRMIRSYYLMGGIVSGRSKTPEQTEMEYQIRNWLYFTWLSGDHFVEQTVHAVDVGNWVANACPIKAHGLGGRQVRNGPGTGQIFDHGVVEYEFANGCRHLVFARQIPGCFTQVNLFALGTKGEMSVGGGLVELGRGNSKAVNAYQVQHDRLFAAIHAGQPFFEGDYAATSAMSAIMGRMALYSGKEVTWDAALNSKLSLSPAKYALDADPPVLPDKDGKYPVAVPGNTVAW
ncbi:MAG: Gfo/Idh/MocA family oxidoreductase [Verrucomicrobiia bacterium]